jgi:hypothetical protein
VIGIRSILVHLRTAVGVGLLGAGACVLVLGVDGASGSVGSPPASAARTISLSESGSLHRTYHHGVRLDEAGNASGTIRGSIYIHLDVTSQNRVSAEVNIYPSNGSLSGSSTANYRVDGGQATFSGTLSITRGTGTYAHAHASRLSFSGTIQRSNDNTTVHLSGPLSY